MDSRLFMEIGFVNTTFQAIDQTPYERWINDGIFDNNSEHMVLQRLIEIKTDDNVVLDGGVIVSEPLNNVDLIRDPYTKEGITNGLYYYQKLIIPSEEHTSSANEQLYFDSEGIIHYIDIDSHIEKTFTDYDEAFDEMFSIITQEHPNNCFYFDDYCISIYDLVECYVKVETAILNDYLKNGCKTSCNKDVNLYDHADILLAAIMSIRHLIEKGDYFEAQHILESLSTCGNLCGNWGDNHINKKCGCGEA